MAALPGAQLELTCRWRGGWSLSILCWHCRASCVCVCVWKRLTVCSPFASFTHLTLLTPPSPRCTFNWTTPLKQMQLHTIYLYMGMGKGKLACVWQRIWTMWIGLLLSSEWNILSDFEWQFGNISSMGAIEKLIMKSKSCFIEFYFKIWTLSCIYFSTKLRNPL